MTMRVIPFPRRHADQRGTVCVMGDTVAGFEVAHESASGSSWGSFSGPYFDSREEIAAAHALNRETYAGECHVSICDAALRDCQPVGDADSPQGDF